MILFMAIELLQEMQLNVIELFWIAKYYPHVKNNNL